MVTETGRSFWGRRIGTFVSYITIMVVFVLLPKKEPIPLLVEIPLALCGFSIADAISWALGRPWGGPVLLALGRRKGYRPALVLGGLALLGAGFSIVEFVLNGQSPAFWFTTAVWALPFTLFLPLYGLERFEVREKGLLNFDELIRWNWVQSCHWGDLRTGEPNVLTLFCTRPGDMLPSTSSRRWLLSTEACEMLQPLLLAHLPVKACPPLKAEGAGE